MVGATTLASAQSKKHLAIAGGSAGDPVEYYFRIDGAVEKTGDGGGAVDDRYVTIDSQDYVRSRDDGTVVARGVVAGGGDAYYYTGEIVDFGVSLDHDTADRASIYHDGRKYGVEEFGPNPPANAPITYHDAQTATVEGEWGTVRVGEWASTPSGPYDDVYYFENVSGTTTISNDAKNHPGWYIRSVGVAEKELQEMLSFDYQPRNPFGGPWNHEVRESDLPNRIVLSGGSADDKLEYSFDVTDAVQRTGYAGDDAPIADKHVHIDDDDYIDGSLASSSEGGATVTGNVAGGGDAYWFSGDVTNLQADEGVEIHVNGEPRRPDETGSGGGGDDELSRHLVVYGGSADNVINYEVAVSGELAKSESGGDAPIADEHIHIDDDDVIEGSTVTGNIAGGGDAYRFSGEVTNIEADGDANVYVDGERRM